MRIVSNAGVTKVLTPQAGRNRAHSIPAGLTFAIDVSYGLVTLLHTSTMPLPATLHPGYYGKGSLPIPQDLAETQIGEPKGEVRRLAIAADALITQPKHDSSEDPFSSMHEHSDILSRH
jgi:hypothetical protein